MNEPIFARPVLVDRSFSWDAGASLAMMLGMPFRQDPEACEPHGKSPVNDNGAR